MRMRAGTGGRPGRATRARARPAPPRGGAVRGRCDTPPVTARPSRPRLVTILWATFGALAVATALGLALLWPDPRPLDATLLAGQLNTEEAEVVELRSYRCAPGRPQICRRAAVALESGPEAGGRATIDVPGGFELDPGDHVRVFRSASPPEVSPRVVRYTFADFERRTPLLALAAVFAVLVVAVARWRGVRALAGLALSLVVVVLFVVPAILEGHSALLVAAVGASAIMLVTITLVHGLGPKTLAASLGTAASLLITVGLARAAADVTHLTGLASEDAQVLRAATGGLSVQGCSWPGS
jgi:hypothetical protein